MSTCCTGGSSTGGTFSGGGGGGVDGCADWLTSLGGSTISKTWGFSLGLKACTIVATNKPSKTTRCRITDVQKGWSLGNLIVRP